MKNNLAITLTVLFLTTFNFGQELFAQKLNKDFVENELIIWLESNVDANAFANRNSKDFQIQPIRQLSKRLNIWLFRYENRNGDRDKDLLSLRLTKESRFVQNNHYVTERVDPDDTDYPLQWAPDMIDLPEAWDITTGGTSTLEDEIVIAVIDGGFDIGHEDISFWKNNNEIDGNGIDDDGNGYIDDFDGWNAYNSTGNIPSNSHGTHVAGIAGATGNNTQGIAGVNWNVGIMPIAGSTGVEATAVEAYSYVLEMRALYNETDGDQGAYIVATNSSFGVDEGDPDDFPIWCSMYNEMGEVGILSCAATANQNWDIDDVGDVPTTCSSNYLIGVTNTNSSDAKVEGAGFGPNNIDIGAPGQGIHSTLPGNNYGSLSGTSMASPQVAGTIALMYSAVSCERLRANRDNPAAFALAVKEALLDGSDNIAALNGLVGHGRLNALGAVENIVAGNTIAPDVSTLPNGEGDVYNYGIENENIINGCTINADGILRVNHVGATRYLDGPNTSLQTYSTVSGCIEEDIIINSGGRFVLGNDITDSNNPNSSVTRRAYVSVASGRTVHVKSGGMLRLVRGSRLIIEEGARIIIDEGAIVHLWWSDSKIQVKGEMVINGDFTFSGSGYFQFDNGNTFTLNADFNLTGQNTNHRFIHLNSGATLNVNSHAINLERGTVTYNSGSKIYVNDGASISTNRNKFKNNSSSSNLTDATAIYLKNPERAYFFFTYFENLSTAVEMEGSPDTEFLKFFYCFFNNNITGFFGGETPALNFQSCTFDALDEGGIAAAIYNIPDVNLSGVTIKNYNSPGAIGLWLYEVEDAYVSGSRFYDNTRSVSLFFVPSYHMNGGVIEFTTEFFNPNGSVGIHAPYEAQNNSNVKLTNNAQIKEQEVGIKIDKGGIFDGTNSVYGKVTMDCAKLINNETGIQGTDVTLDIDAFVHCNCTDLSQAKPNSFIKSAWHGGIDDHFEICYQDITVPGNQISAQANYWSGGSDDNSYLLRYGGLEGCFGPNDISLINDIQAEEEPEGCTSDDDIKYIRGRNKEPNFEQSALANGFEMDVYPNPSNGQFNIELNEGLYNVVIYDVLGKVVAEENNVSNSLFLNAEKWTKGIYLINAIEQSTNTRLQNKLVIQ